MAGTSLLVLLDDITAILDDIALMSRMAAKKTAGVLGDDLALNAHQVSGLDAARELPVVWAVARGSLVNKLILVPAALLISALLPALITPLLMAGGLYLCFEGAEKLVARWLHPKAAATGRAELRAALVDPTVDLVTLEQAKIRGAVRTDFILSAEIIIIALGVVADSTLAIRVGVLAAIALAMTVGVYGLVAAIVKFDDLGLWLVARGRAAAAVGRGVLWLAPWILRSLAVAGTAAMFLVGGSIVLHGLPMLAGGVHALLAALPAAGASGGVMVTVAQLAADALVGIASGLVVVLVVTGVQAAKRRLRAQAIGG
ncbi:MAG: DUF808 domain-containing protein [Gammaproteobacteria bacterium]